MAIADTINSIRTHLTADYESLENIGAELENVDKNIENIASVVNGIYDNLPKTTGEDTSLSLTTLKGKMNIIPKGDTKQTTYNGYNIFAEIQTQTLNGMTITKTDNGYILNGTTTANTTFRGTITNAASTNKTICAKCDTAITNANVQIKTRNSSASQLRSISLGTANTWVVDSGTYEDYYCDIYIKSGTTLNNALIQPMLLSGTYTSSTIPNYEPYVGGTASPNPTYPQNIEVVTGEQEVKVENKNLWNKSKMEFYNNNNSAFIDTGGTSTIRARTNSINISELGLTTETTYILSGLPSGWTLRQIRQYTEYGGTSTDKIASSNNTFSITSGFKYIHFMFGNENGTTTPSTLFEQANIQLEKGSTATTYVEHQEQTQTISLGDIELCKIGNYQDYLYKSNGKWYKKALINKIANKTNWVVNSIATNNRAIVVLASNGYGNAVNGYSTINAICNMLVAKSQGTQASDTAINTIAINNENIYIKFADTINTKELAKAQLDSMTTLEIYYVVATPQDIEITNTTLIEQLDNLEKMKSYNGVTNINCSGNLSAILSVSALKGE